MVPGKKVLVKQNPGKKVLGKIVPGKNVLVKKNPGKTVPARPFPTVWYMWDCGVSIKHLLVGPHYFTETSFHRNVVLSKHHLSEFLSRRTKKHHRT